MVKFPQELNSDTELHLVVDDETDVLAAHHNALKDAIKALEEKVGIDNSTVPSSLDAKKVNSSPPDGSSKVKNVYLDEANQEYVIII